MQRFRTKKESLPKMRVNESGECVCRSNLSCGIAARVHAVMSLVDIAVI